MEARRITEERMASFRQYLLRQSFPSQGMVCAIPVLGGPPDIMDKSHSINHILRNVQLLFQRKDIGDPGHIQQMIPPVTAKFPASFVYFQCLHLPLIKGMSA